MNVAILIASVVLPVDDGSADGSAEAIRAYAETFTSRHASRAACRPVLIAKNAGKGSALKAGFRASSGGYVLLLDGDLDIAPKMLPKFFDSMAKNASDIVVGSKRHPESSSYVTKKTLDLFAKKAYNITCLFIQNT